MASRSTRRGSRSEVIDTLASVFAGYAGGKRGGAGADANDRDVDESSPRSSRRQASESVRITEEVRTLELELRRRDREIEELRARLRSDEEAQRNEELLQTLSEETQELRDRAKMMEVQMRDVRSDNERLRAAYNEALSKLGESLRVLEDRATAQGSIEAQMRGVADRADAAEREAAHAKQERDIIAGRSVEALALHEKQLKAREDEIAVLRGQLSNTGDAQTALQRNGQVWQSRAEQLEHQLMMQQQEHQLRDAALVAELDKIRGALAGLRGAAEEAQSLRAQVAHVRYDAARLLRLLASTEEYAAFAAQAFPTAAQAPRGAARSIYLGAAPVVGSGASDHFLGGPAAAALPPTAEPIPQHALADPAPATWDELAAFQAEYVAKELAAIAQPVRSPLLSVEAGAGPVPDGPGSEMARWVPAEAVAIATRFRQHYGKHVPAEAMRRLLLLLNTAWIARTKELLVRGKAKLTKEIAALRRQLSQSKPYREVMQASTIARLHAELNALKDSFGLSGGAAGATTAAAEAASSHRGRSTSRSGRASSTVGQRTRASSPTSMYSRRSSVAHGTIRDRDLLSGGPSLARSRSRSPGAYSVVSAAYTAAPPGEKIPVSLLSVPGSGARRLDAQESARLFESALASVELLSRDVAALEGECEELRDLCARHNIPLPAHLQPQQQQNGGGDGDGDGVHRVQVQAVEDVAAFGDEPVAAHPRRMPQPIPHLDALGIGAGGGGGGYSRPGSTVTFASMPASVAGPPPPAMTAHPPATAAAPVPVRPGGGGGYGTEALYSNSAGTVFIPATPANLSMLAMHSQSQAGGQPPLLAVLPHSTVTSGAPSRAMTPAPPPSFPAAASFQGPMFGSRYSYGAPDAQFGSSASSVYSSAGGAGTGAGAGRRLSVAEAVRAASSQASAAATVGGASAMPLDVSAYASYGYSYRGGSGASGRDPSGRDPALEAAVGLLNSSTLSTHSYQYQPSR